MTDQKKKKQTDPDEIYNMWINPVASGWGGRSVPYVIGCVFPSSTGPRARGGTVRKLGVCTYGSYLQPGT